MYRTLVQGTLVQGPTSQSTGQSMTLQNCCERGGGWGHSELGRVITFRSPCATCRGSTQVNSGLRKTILTFCLHINLPYFSQNFCTPPTCPPCRRPPHSRLHITQPSCCWQTHSSPRSCHTLTPSFLCRFLSFWLCRRPTLCRSCRLSPPGHCSRLPPCLYFPPPPSRLLTLLCSSSRTGTAKPVPVPVLSFLESRSGQKLPRTRTALSTS